MFEGGRQEWVWSKIAINRPIIKAEPTWGRELSLVRWIQSWLGIENLECDIQDRIVGGVVI